MSQSNDTSPPPFGEFVELDRLLHAPARMAITSALSSVESADFVFLQSQTGLSKGNLASHLGKLEDGEIVETTKHGGVRPRTVIRLTGSGREAVDRHWEKLLRLRDSSRAGGRQES